MKKLDVVIVGSGIVGLAVGYQLLKSNRNLRMRILEKETEVAKHQTGNNSGVIHSGIYYKPGSLKANNCIEGRKELLVFCENFGIKVQKLGKVIVATDQQQLGRLSDIEARGKANGVALERACKARLKEIEPHVEALEGLWVPDCAIVSYKQVADRLALEFQKLGGELGLGEEVLSIGNSLVRTSKDEYHSKCTVNCAGLFSDRIAKGVFGEDEMPGKILPFRGEYYELCEAKKHLVRGLIYPVPDPRFPFLGVHLTRMIDGKVEAGPNAVLAMKREGYRKTDFDLKDCIDTLSFSGFWKMAASYWQAGLYEMARSFSKDLFLRDLQKLVPGIEKKDLEPAGAGVRAQMVTREGKTVDDFMIMERKDMIHVLNAPSPAATASFSIGKKIAALVCARFPLKVMESATVSG